MTRRLSLCIRGLTLAGRVTKKVAFCKKWPRVSPPTPPVVHARLCVTSIPGPPSLRVQRPTPHLCILYLQPACPCATCPHARLLQKPTKAPDRTKHVGDVGLCSRVGSRLVVGGGGGRAHLSRQTLPRPVHGGGQHALRRQDTISATSRCDQTTILLPRQHNARHLDLFVLATGSPHASTSHLGGRR